MSRYERPNQGNGCGTVILALLFRLLAPLILEIIGFIILVIIIAIIAR
jgi:hypothetical protein